MPDTNQTIKSRFFWKLTSYFSFAILYIKRRSQNSLLKKVKQSLIQNGIAETAKKILKKLTRHNDIKAGTGPVCQEPSPSSETGSNGGKEDTTATSVSVVIPTYNAGRFCEPLMKKLREQKRLGSLEIIVVDSGSTDGTPEICERHQAKVIHISQEEFSHSYARNLGARAATGDILLFMTQDASPSCEDWIAKMILPILRGQAAAVSCREECPDDADLYYKASARNFYHWMGVSKEDRITGYAPSLTLSEQRTSAAITDISCAIERNIFQKYEYRYNYAEDLDLGLRLIQGGYHLALLHEPTVIHGHNRPADYYFSRAYTDKKTLAMILEEQIEYHSAEEYRQSILPGYLLLQSIIKKLSEVSCRTPESLLIWFDVFADQGADDPSAGIEGEGTVKTLLRTLQADQAFSPQKNNELVRNARWFLLHVLRPYLEELPGNTTIDMSAVCESINKHISYDLGVMFACIDPAEEISAKAAKLINRV